MSQSGGRPWRSSRAEPPLQEEAAAAAAAAAGRLAAQGAPRLQSFSLLKCLTTKRNTQSSEKERARDAVTAKTGTALVRAGANSSE